MKNVIYGLLALFAIIGMAGAANVLNQGTVPPVEMTLSVTGCAAMDLERGTTQTCTDTATVDSNYEWKLTVEDLRNQWECWWIFCYPYPAEYRGYMSMWQNDEVGYKHLTYPYLVKKNGGFVDALRWGPVTIVADGEPSADPQIETIEYFQEVAGDEVAGTYGIELVYTLAPR